MGDVLDKPDKFLKARVATYVIRLESMGVIKAVSWAREFFGFELEARMRPQAMAQYLKNRKSKKKK